MESKLSKTQEWLKIFESTRASAINIYDQYLFTSSIKTHNLSFKRKLKKTHFIEKYEKQCLNGPKKHRKYAINAMSGAMFTGSSLSTEKELKTRWITSNTTSVTRVTVEEVAFKGTNHYD